MKAVWGAGIAFAAILAAAPVLATDVFECEFAEQDVYGKWLPTVVVVEHDTATGDISVYDPLIKHFKGRPIPGKVETNNDIRISYTWKLDDMKDNRNTSASFSFRLTIRKADMGAKVSSKALGYANGAEEAPGRCKKHKG